MLSDVVHSSLYSQKTAILCTLSRPSKGQHLFWQYKCPGTCDSVWCFVFVSSYLYCTFSSFLSHKSFWIEMNQATGSSVDNRSKFGLIICPPIEALFGRNLRCDFSGVWVGGWVGGGNGNNNKGVRGEGIVVPLPSTLMELKTDDFIRFDQLTNLKEILLLQDRFWEYANEIAEIK